MCHYATSEVDFLKLRTSRKLFVSYALSERELRTPCLVLWFSSFHRPMELCFENLFAKVQSRAPIKNEVSARVSQIAFHERGENREIIEG